MGAHNDPDCVYHRYPDGVVLRMERADLDVNRRPRVSTSTGRAKPFLTLPAPAVRRPALPVSPAVVRAPITPRVEFPMGSTNDLNTVDGSWARSNALLKLLYETAGDVGRMHPDVRAAAARNATLSGWARALVKAAPFGGAAGNPRDRDLLSRSLRTIDELSRVVAHSTSSDGTVPQLLVLPITRFVDTSRPAITACNRMVIPKLGPSFLRPRTTQPTLISATGSEGNVAPSQRWTTSGDVVNKTFVGFTLSLSEVELDQGGDFSLDTLAIDLAKSFALETSKLFAASIETALGTLAGANTTVLSTTAASDAVMTALGAAIPNFVTATNMLPNVLLMSSTRYAQFSQLVDAQKRPVPAAMICDALGVIPVCEPQFASGTLALARSEYLEWYEPAEMSEIIGVGAPSTAELNVSFSASVAAYTPPQALHNFTVA